jgi:hypothetical protein
MDKHSFLALSDTGLSSFLIPDFVNAVAAEVFLN